MTKRIRILFMPAILLTGLMFSPVHAESNEVLNMRLEEDETSLMLEFLLEKRPAFSLMPVEGDRIELIIKNTEIKFPIQDKTIELMANSKSDLEFVIYPEKPYYKIDTSWLEGEKLLYIEIFSEQSKKIENESQPIKSTLKNIRFGFMDNAIRMVMNISEKPQWKMTFHDPKRIDMELDAKYRSTEREKYGPLKGLIELIIQRIENDQMNLNLKFESDLNHISVFWMEIGSRMVMDLFNEVSMPEKKNILLRQVSLPGTKEDSPEIRESLNSERFMDILADETGSHEKDSTPEPANIIKMQIPKREKLEISSLNNSSDLKTTDHNLSKIRPGLNEEIIGNTPELESVSGLNPQEAFLFGRIKQALEINDFNKGILLAEQYLKEFPESVLIEKILFWRSDLYYRIWKGGEKEISGKLIQSYKYAIDRFPKSEYSAWAYIKMAQVNSETGNNLTAVGHLSMLINRMKKGDCIPLAYLTRGKIYMLIDQNEKAVIDFKIILKEFEDSGHATEARFWIANYYHTMGLYNEAEKYLMEIQDSYADFHLRHPEYFLISAKNYLYLKKYDLAREYLFKALNLGDQPETIDLLLSRIGDTYHHQEKEADAEKFYRMVLDYYPGSEGAAIAKLRLANYFSDITMLENIQAEKNNEPLGDLAILEKGYQLYEKDRYRDVIETLSELILKPVKTETREDAKRLYYKSAEMELSRLYKEKRFKELLDLYDSEKSRIKDNINPEIFLLIGKTFNIQKRYSEAIDILSNIKSYDLDTKKIGDLFIELAGAFICQNQKDSARKLLKTNMDKNLDIEDRNRMIRMLADVFLDEERIDDAYDLYQSLLKKAETLSESEMAKICMNSGKILIMKKKDEDAESFLRKGISLAEKMDATEEFLQTAHIELGKILHREKKFKEAAESFERVFALGFGPDRKDYWDTRFNLALSYLGAGDGRKAEPVLIEISEEADEITQQRAQIRMGALSLEKQIERLPIGYKSGD